MLALLMEKEHLLSHSVYSSSLEQPAAVPSTPEASALVVLGPKLQGFVVFFFSLTALVEQYRVFCLSAVSFSAQLFVKASAEEDILGVLEASLTDFAHYKR